MSICTRTVMQTWKYWYQDLYTKTDTIPGNFHRYRFFYAQQLHVHSSEWFPWRSMACISITFLSLNAKLTPWNATIFLSHDMACFQCNIIIFRANLRIYASLSKNLNPAINVTVTSQACSPAIEYSSCGITNTVAEMETWAFEDIP